MLDQVASFLFTTGVPRQPASNPDLRVQARELLATPGHLRASWDGVRRRLEAEGYEAGEFGLVCRVQLNLLDNCSALLESLAPLADELSLPPDELRRAAAEVQELIEAVRPLYELATRKPPPLDPAKLRAAEARYSGEQAVEVGELIRQVQAGEAEL